MKKSSFITILLIFILPIALYYFFKTPPESNTSIANPSGNMPKVIKFSSDMCYDCKKIEKEIKPLMQEYQQKIIFESINVSSTDQNTEFLVRKHNVNVVPTLIFLDKNGNTVRKTEGYAPGSQLRIYLNEISNS
ncbi:MAG TPA: thioredoxin family protein [Candidatus Gastranaerophilales bacterium]|nr:thioredoxin family protein [Candidatus Gastranaerophilales bacterium]